jgi:hypothetical protein
MNKIGSRIYKIRYSDPQAKFLSILSKILSILSKNNLVSAHPQKGTYDHLHPIN